MDLNNIDIFSSLSSNSVQELQSSIVYKKYRKNHLISNDIDLEEFALYIIKGLIKVYKLKRDGDSYLINVIGENNFLGIGLTFGNNLSSSINNRIKCISDSEIIILPRELIYY